MNAFGDAVTLISILVKPQTSRILAVNTMKSFQGTKEDLPSRLACISFSVLFEIDTI